MSDNTNYDNQPPSMTLIERLENAGKFLGISRRELTNEMTLFASANNSDGLRQLFNAYKAWEMRNRPQGVSDEQTEELAMDNFDSLANYADNLNATHDGPSAFAMIPKEPNGMAGKITRFCRDAIGYHPQLDSSLKN